MYRAELQKLEGVWTGTERIGGEKSYEATGRLEFHTVFDGKFLLCDYIQTAPERPTTVAHGVFWKDDKSGALTVNWFRNPTGDENAQDHGIAEGDKLIFVENAADHTTRTTYSVALNRLTIITERSSAGREWATVFEGSYRRPRG